MNRRERRAMARRMTKGTGLRREAKRETRRQLATMLLEKPLPPEAVERQFRDPRAPKLEVVEQELWSP